jgi:hypothetical protein
MTKPTWFSFTGDGSFVEIGEMVQIDEDLGVP